MCWIAARMRRSRSCSSSSFHSEAELDEAVPDGGVVGAPDRLTELDLPLAHREVGAEETGAVEHRFVLIDQVDADLPLDSGDAGLKLGQPLLEPPPAPGP
jgi:hypothetical protein